MPNKKKINWFKESGNSVSSIIRVLRGILSAILVTITTILIIGVICAVIVGGAFAAYLFNFVDSEIDEFEMLASEQKQTSQIYVDDGKGNLIELEDQKLYASENRVWVDYSEIPQDLIDAYIAIEDKRFNDHHGVDWIRTFRATMLFMVGKSDSGGSTLTQQLIKNITGDDDNTPQRKIEEIFRAINLEKVYSKEQIMEMYLNTIYLSQGCNGVQAASYSYFGKPVSELSLIECAAIASITQNPSKWDPRVHPENNIIRRNSILDHMLDQGKITKTEYDQAYDQELTLYEEDDIWGDQNENTGFETHATSWYVDVVIEETIELLMQKYNVNYSVAEQMLFTGGLQIVCAMDMKVQKIVEDIFKDDEKIDEIIGAKPGMMKPQASMVVLHPENGNILAVVGGRGEKTKSRVFNFATQAKRQTGSSIKPLSVYGPALEAGLINYSTVYDDSPFEYDKVTNEPWPHNSPNYYSGFSSVIDAITRSLNTVAVRILDQFGIDESYNFLTKTLHITSLVERQVSGNVIVTDKNLASLALGGMSYGISVKELTGAYTMISNEGVFTKPRSVLEIRDRQGEEILNNDPVTEVAMSRENASILKKMMNNVMVNGTGASSKLKELIFTSGKTGSTNKNYDKWFVGFTPYYLGGVWIGYEQPQTLNEFRGSTALKIWDYCMIEIHKQMVFMKNPDGNYNYSYDQNGSPIPKVYNHVKDSGVLELQFCADCGKLATEHCKQDARGSRVRTGYFTLDNRPTEYCTCHQPILYCTVGKGLATEHCPKDCCVELSIVVDPSVEFRNIDEEGKNRYIWRVDEEHVFYKRANGTYGGVSSKYSNFCTLHNTSNEELLSFVVLAPPPFIDDDKKLLTR